MKIEITEVKDLTMESIHITATVYRRGLPRPKYEENETDEQYTERVKDIAKDLDSFNNLHLGWAVLSQDVDKVKIPKVAKYDT